MRLWGTVCDWHALATFLFSWVLWFKFRLDIILFVPIHHSCSWGTSSCVISSNPPSISDQTYRGSQWNLMLSAEASFCPQPLSCKVSIVLTLQGQGHPPTIWDWNKSTFLWSPKCSTLIFEPHFVQSNPVCGAHFWQYRKTMLCWNQTQGFLHAKHVLIPLNYLSQTTKDISERILKAFWNCLKHSSSFRTAKQP